MEKERKLIWQDFITNTMTNIRVIIVKAKILVTYGKHDSAVRYVNIKTVEIVKIVKIVTQWTYKLTFSRKRRKNGI